MTIDRRAAIEIVNSVLAALGFEVTGGLGGWFVNRRTAKDYNVRPGTHDLWSRKNPSKLGLTPDEAATWMRDREPYQKLFKDWMRVDKYGSALTFMLTAPISKRDLHSMQDFASDHRAGKVVVEETGNLPRGTEHKAYDIPWMDFLGMERPSDFRGHAV